MPDVTWTMSADAAKAIGEMSKVALEFKRIEAASGQTGRATKDHADGATKALSAMQGQIMGIVGGYLSINTAIGVGKTMLEDYLRLHRQTVEVAKQWSEGRATALEMRPGEHKAIGAMVAGAARASGMAETEIWRAAPAALSAGKGLSLAQIGSSLGQAGRVARLQGTGAEGIATRSQFTQDIMRITGTQDAREAMGSLMSIVASARGITAEGVAESFVPAITGYQLYGDTFQETAGTMAGMSYLMGDVSGEETATGYANMRQRLASRPLVRGKQLKAKTTVGRLKELGAYYRTLSGPAQYKLLTQVARSGIYQGKVHSLLMNDPSAWKAIEESTATTVGPGAKAAANFETFIGEVLATPEAQMGEMTATGTAAREELVRNRLPQATGVVLYDEMMKGLEASGASWRERQGAKISYLGRRAIGYTPEVATLETAETFRNAFANDPTYGPAFDQLVKSLQNAADAAIQLKRGSQSGGASDPNAGGE
jgi:hypothetical protein